MTQPRRSGLLFGVGAYVWWGLCPGFFLLLLPATATEVLAHRFVWSAVFLLVVLAVARRLGDLRRLRARTWLQLLAAAAFIGINWGTYIWAVTNGHVVDAALGYFINPLISVALGVVIFRERLGAWQLAALALAIVAVGVLTAEVGEPPYIALVLAVSFGLYGLIKKVVDADPRVSVTVETLWGLPVAVGYLVWLQIAGQAHFVNHGPGQATLLLLAGPVTAIPLLLFAAAAQRLPLVTLGLLFYLNPALQMAWGVVIGGEPMPPMRWLGFALIWAALGVFSVDAVRRARADRRAPALTVDPANL
ncbi:EamA family transporter RarD [Mycolicibacterium elephantis]|uniref:EamA family transporter n=1 Tax=Mycolicibacterium elephantis TaxID=81858 RepID=A0A0M2ZMQ7_9MYCO|nr:EamA family transporter RarD [Mycolicibacterium elephantis]KKW65480.1 protein rarD [Mycolicibacterium elephantis]OBB25725.1 protein rarD [Mycolicibacterium elephantis]OBE97897.1 protein rarD [Mycolicibacterium elephantis]ORA62391.1 EamA family transporter [Mycolicibacterium elephantis]